MTRNALRGGARRGRSAVPGIRSADAVQGQLAAAGLRVGILPVEPL
ncbi:MAG: hypothetical protein M0T72_10190 [Candidatus Dormibacteraeota bacterium]|nr:hypothetical protein [Candidatus Dormibacteraeota bacterium]